MKLTISSYKLKVEYGTFNIYKRNGFYLVFWWPKKWPHKSEPAIKEYNNFKQKKFKTLKEAKQCCSDHLIKVKRKVKSGDNV